jgi:hypothetical protein
MWLQIAAASSGFAVPEKILKRRSSFDTRERRACGLVLSPWGELGFDTAFPSAWVDAGFGVAAATASIVSDFTRTSSWLAWNESCLQQRGPNC